MHPETPAEGKPLAELFAGRNVDLPGMLAQLRRVADQLNLDFGDRTHTYNSRMAQEVGKWAEHKGRGHSYHAAVFRAYFADGRNIAEVKTLLSICRTAGLDPEEALGIIDARTYREAVDSDWRRSRRLGITAVPTFRLGEVNLVGAQPYERLSDLLKGRRVSPRSLQR